MSDMKLIMEGWRTYVESLEYEEPKVFLFEGQEKKSEKNLSLLFEEADKGLLTEEEVLKAWRKTVLYESQQLINEGVMDALKNGWEAMKKGGKWLTDKVVAAYKWAAQKFNDFIVNVWGGINIALIRAAKSAKSNMYISSVLEDLSALNQRIEDFKDDHPIIFKATVVILTVGVVCAVLASMSSEAMAVVKEGKRELSEQNINGLKGLLQAACEHDAQMCSATSDLIQNLNDYASAAQGGGPEGGLNANEVLQLAGKGMSDAEKTLSLTNNWWKSVVDNYNENVDVFNKMRDEYLKQNPGATTMPTSSPLGQQQSLVQDLKDSLDIIIQNGKESTLRTIERVVNVTEDGKSYVSSIRAAGEAPKTGLDQAIGQGAAKLYGELPGEIIRKVRGY